MAARKKGDLVVYPGDLFPTEARKPPSCPLLKPPSCYFLVPFPSPEIQVSTGKDLLIPRGRAGL